MKIKMMQISNYRKIHSAKINMEDNITVIAGANNSGKTSLIELLGYVFGKSKGKFSRDDYSALECQSWSKAIWPAFSAVFKAGYTKEKAILDICELVSDGATGANMQLAPIEIKVQVDYSETADDIRHFADYIMEFDPANTSFYFVYRYALSQDTFRKSLDTEFEKFSTRFSKLTGDDANDKDIIRIISDMLISLYANSSEESVFFSDSNYSNLVSMDTATFKSLFNYQNIMAGRTLDDENSDRTHILSKNMIDIASKEDDWKDLIRSLPDQIIQPIQDAKIQERVRTASLATLDNTIKAVSKTNGGHAGSIIIDMNVTEDAVQSLLKSITSAKYQADSHFLSESSQGLGYSNLIFIHLQLEKFKKTIDPLVVNFFVVEEPEAHMHPQMQHVFAQYLFDYYNQESHVQGVLTTHSHEVVRTAKISQLRVLRQTSAFECSAFDLREFQDTIAKDKELLDFYDWFYTINFPDIIFADKIIMYEGDTERMLMKSILSSEKFSALRNQYLSYVQVGGAYAFNYKPIVEFLGIKTALITDLDYDKSASSIADIQKSGTTNYVINKFAELCIGKATPTIQNLYDWQKSSKPIVYNDLICLAFQGLEDGYSRTLEEAMLSKHYGITAIEEKSKSDWKELRKKDKLKYTIPRGDDNCNLGSIVAHTSNGKTDFMYSAILNGMIEDMLPKYIEEALLWLNN